MRIRKIKHFFLKSMICEQKTHGISEQNNDWIETMKTLNVTER